LGRWNFRNFASLAPGTSTSARSQITEEDLTKTIYKFSFSKANLYDNNNNTFNEVPLLDYNYYYKDSKYNKIDLYDFHIEGSGFVRKQVRRMIGVLLGVGRGTIESSIILNMLSSPKQRIWPPSISSTLAEGLFLKSVNYKNIDILRGPLSS
jgi:tRNA U38,U39,U40 pseudouridine synthase TruA